MTRRTKRPPRRNDRLSSRPTSAGEIHDIPALRELRDRRRQFVLHYCGIIGDARNAWNASLAARLAGYPEDAARRRGYTLLRDPKVAAAVAQLVAELEKRGAAIAQRSLAELRAVAFTNLHDVITFDRRGKPSGIKKNLPPELAAAISEVSVGEDGRFRVKMHSKVAALQTLLKAYGHLQDRPVQVAIGIAEEGRQPVAGQGVDLDQRSKIRVLFGLPPEEPRAEDAEAG